MSGASVTSRRSASTWFRASDRSFRMKGHRTALITGASSGIGETFARMFAKDGMDLVLVARSEDKLRGLAGELTEGGKRRVEVVPMDLGVEGAAGKLKNAVDAL